MVDIGYCDNGLMDSFLNHQKKKESIEKELADPDVPKEKIPLLRQRLSKLSTVLTRQKEKLLAVCQ